MKRVISGVKPTGDITIGNYLGTMRTWASHQGASAEVFYFLADLHALNIRQDPKVLHQNSLAAVAWLLAMGINPKQSVVFVESQVAAIPQLFTILNNYVTMGELSRMTQFKDKSRQLGPEGQVVGLFEYPALMAADILLFDIDEVPVGADQKQHVELARNIAERFNSAYGETFKVPKAVIQSEGARIMDLQDPTKKMSKSETASGYILMIDDPDVIRDKIKRAVTDSGDVIKAGSDKPALTNLLNIFALVSGKPVADIESEYTNKGYGEFKNDLAEAVVAELEPLQKTYHELIQDTVEVESVLIHGLTKATDIADTKIVQVKKVLGLL